jgi:hypothetical protein
MLHRMQSFGIAGILLGCVGMAGCAPHSEPATQASAAPTTGATGPVIVRLVGRNYSVVISAGPKAPVYTIRNAQGQLLAQNLTLQELRQDHVDLYDQLAPAISPEGTVSAVWADSRRE